jgi:glutamate synthase domain-containing protein 3
MRFVARELREIMAELGFRSVEEMVGRTDVLTVRSTRHWKAAQVDLSALLHRAEPPKRAEYDAQAQTVSADRSEDALTLMCSGAIQHRERMQAILPIANTDRTAGTRLGYEIAKRYGAEGLPDDTIQLRYVGAAGQSFGAFLPKGVTLLLEGEANDYVGKGLSGGIIAIAPPSRRSFRSEQNIVIGNVAFYGASSGEAYVCGVAGERFAVRNSGANIVVEGVGNHGCEYMTGGKVIVLGEIGRNFAAGMSGGTAYVLGDRRTVEQHCNLKMVELESLTEPEEAETVRKLIEKHVKLTNSDHARTLLRDWEDALQRFVKVIPSDYKKMMRTIERFQRTGATPEEAAYAAFHAIKRA